MREKTIYQKIAEKYNTRAGMDSGDDSEYFN